MPVQVPEVRVRAYYDPFLQYIDGYDSFYPDTTQQQMFNGLIYNYSNGVWYMTRILNELDLATSRSDLLQMVSGSSGPSSILSGQPGTPFEALSHYLRNSGTPMTMNINNAGFDIDVAGLSGIGQRLEAFKSSGDYAAPISFRFGYNTAANGTSIGLTLGYVTMDLRGTMYHDPSDGSIRLNAEMTMRPDVYDFNQSDHRGIVGEALTTIGRQFGGTPFTINMNGSIAVDVPLSGSTNNQRRSVIELESEPFQDEAFARSGANELIFFPRSLSNRDRVDLAKIDNSHLLIYDKPSDTFQSAYSSDLIVFDDKAIDIDDLEMFHSLQYIASHEDLMNVYGANAYQGAAHYLRNGMPEGRATDNFHAFSYVARYADLIGWVSAQDADYISHLASEHYINNGRFEGRVDSEFSSWAYLATNVDLLPSFSNANAGWTVHGLEEASSLHFIKYGFFEGRSADNFNSHLYLVNNPDVAYAIGADGQYYGMNAHEAAAKHYAEYGVYEGRAAYPELI